MRDPNRSPDITPKPGESERLWRTALRLACIYMSLVLLVSSLTYQVTGFALADSLGAIGLVYFSLREGKEAFAKARGLECACAARHDGKGGTGW